jgi:hypothetical protein
MQLSIIWRFDAPSNVTGGRSPTPCTGSCAARLDSGGRFASACMLDPNDVGPV